MPETDIRILIVAGNLLTRAGLASLLEERGCTVVAQSDGNDLDAAVAVGQADALVIDLAWQGDALRSKLAELDPDLPVLALVTEDETDESMRDLMASLAVLPGYGIVPRDSDPDAIASALYALDHGLVVLDPRLDSVARRLLAGERRDYQRFADPARERSAAVAGAGHDQ